MKLNELNEAFAKKTYGPDKPDKPDKPLHKIDQYTPAFQRMLKEPYREYRGQVLQIIELWSTPQIQAYIRGLRGDQFDDPEQHQEMLNVTDRDHLIEYLCEIVWDWGWEGSDHFVKQNWRDYVTKAQKLGIYPQARVSPLNP